MIRKLRLKIVGISLVTVAAVLLSALVVLALSTHSQMVRSSESHLTAALEGKTDKNELPGSSGQPCFVAEIFTGGTIRLSGSSYYNLENQDLVLDIVRSALEEKKDSGVLKDYSLRYMRRAGAVSVRIAFTDCSMERATMRSLLLRSGLVTLAALLVLTGLSYWLAGFAVRPVRRAWQEQKQFVSDASHELKTPLTVIMTNAELLNSPDFDETRRSQFAAHILTMSRQMRQLIEEMLDLARTDSGQSTLIFSQVDLSRLISDAVLPFEPVFFEAGHTLTADIQENITVRGSQQHLRQTVDILLDNARKYAAPSGEISVTLTRCGGRCRLAVSNPGPEISKADLQNIFKRFYRVDEAHTQRGSYGLGLSIARNIILRHRGRIWAESKNGRNTFFVELPVK